VPWTARSFAARHNHKLKGEAAAKAARIATAMVERGVPEGEAIATANKRAAAVTRRSRAERWYDRK
jgi:uncharacterized protein YdaT